MFVYLPSQIAKISSWLLLGDYPARSLSFAFLYFFPFKKSAIFSVELNLLKRDPTSFLLTLFQICSSSFFWSLTIPLIFFLFRLSICPLPCRDKPMEQILPKVLMMKQIRQPAGKWIAVLVGCPGQDKQPKGLFFDYFSLHGCIVHLIWWLAEREEINLEPLVLKTERSQKMGVGSKPRAFKRPQFMKWATKRADFDLLEK